MMDKVTIANLGDLIQPFQNSRFALSALRGMGQDASKQLNTFHTKAAKAMLQDVFVAADGNATPLLINGKSGSYLNLVGKSNEYFFKAIGLEGCRVRREKAWGYQLIFRVDPSLEQM